MSTLYRCSDYIEETCGDCPQGEPHKRDICCGESGSCPIRNLLYKVNCLEYDYDPQCNAGEGFRNQEEK